MKNTAPEGFSIDPAAQARAAADSASAIARRPLVVFDWDGTILDTTAAISISIRYACERMRLPVPSDRKARSVIGLGWRDAMRIIAPACPPDEYAQFSAFYIERYRPEEERVHVFPGVEDVLERLRARGAMLAIATGKSRRGLDAALAQTGLGRLFVDTETADENPSKPDPGMLEAVSLATGFERSEMVMVGDTTHDLAMANAFGCPGVGVTWGAMSEETLREASPAAICHDLTDLARALGV